MQNNTRKHRIINIALQLLEKQIKVRPYSFISSSQTRDYLRLQLEQLEREVFMVLYCHTYGHPYRFMVMAVLLLAHYTCATA